MRDQEFLELLPAAVVEVDCGEDTHRMRWSAGELTALDHDDPEGERILAAIGGTTNGCVMVLDAWQRQRASLRVLTLGSRGAPDRLRVESEDYGGYSPRRRRGSSRRQPMPAAYTSVMAMTGGWAAYGGGPDADPVDDVDALFAMGPVLAGRLAATVAAHWAERVEAGETADADRAALVAALTGRVWLAVEEWVGLPVAAVDVRMTDRTEPPAATFDDGRLTVAVPFRWLSRVWAPGLAVVAGRFTLDTQREGDAVTLSAVEPDGSPARTTMRLSDP